MLKIRDFPHPPGRTWKCISKLLIQDTSCTKLCIERVAHDGPLSDCDYTDKNIV